MSDVRLIRYEIAWLLVTNDPLSTSTVWGEGGFPSWLRKRSARESLQFQWFLREINLHHSRITKSKPAFAIAWYLSL